MDSGNLLDDLPLISFADFLTDSSKGRLTVDPTSLLVGDVGIATMPERFVRHPRGSFPRSNLRLAS